MKKGNNIIKENMNKEKWLSISELSELLVRGESSIRRQVIKAGLKKNK